MQQKKIDQLLEFGLDGVDSVKARDVLQKHNWNIETAVNSLLTAMTSPNASEAPPLIDLTGPDVEPFVRPSAPSPRPSDDSPMNNAETSTLHPSTRDDTKQEWAVVPASDATKPHHIQQQQEASDIDRAIQLSMSDSYSKASEYVDLPPVERIRTLGNPVALRLTQPVQRDALVLQALYAIPQLREAILGLPPLSDGDPTLENYWRGFECEARDRSQPAAYLGCLQRLFSFMALTSRKYLNVDAAVAFLGGPDEVGHQAFSTAQCRPLDVLFRATSAYASSQLGLHRRLFRSILVGESPVQMDIITLQPQASQNALFPCLFQAIWPRAFRDMADVLVFEIDRSKAENEQTEKSSRQLFTFPAEPFLDQFMVTHESRAKERMEKHKAAEIELKLLRTKRNALLSFDNKDTVQSIRATVTYLENHASSAELTTRLRAIDDRVERESRALQRQIDTANSIISETFVVSGDQHQEYGLRAIIIEDGQYGRTHNFAYIQHPSGQWFRLSDLDMTPTTREEALRDTSGLHLGAGPTYLFYSRAIDQEHPGFQPDVLVQEPHRAQVYADNARFDEELRNAERTLEQDDRLESESIEVRVDRREPVKPQSSEAEGTPMDIDIPLELTRIA